MQVDDDEFDYDFLRTLGALHSKDKDLIGNENFFKNSYESKSQKKKSDTPMTLKDYERQMVLKELDGQDANAEESEDYNHNDDKPLKIDAESDSDDDDDSLLTSGLFKKKETSSRELDRKKQSTSKVFFID